MLGEDTLDRPFMTSEDHKTFHLISVREFRWSLLFQMKVIETAPCQMEIIETAL